MYALLALLYLIFFSNWLLGVYFPLGAGLLLFNFIYPCPIHVDLVQSFSHWTYFIVWIYHILFISFSIQGCSVYFRVFLILKNVAVLSAISFSAKVIFLRNPKHAPGGSNIRVEGFMVGPCMVSSLELCFLVIFLIQISTPIELFKFGFWEGRFWDPIPQFSHPLPRAKAGFLWGVWARRWRPAPGAWLCIFQHPASIRGQALECMFGPNMQRSCIGNSLIPLTVKEYRKYGRKGPLVKSFKDRFKRAKNEAFENAKTVQLLWEAETMTATFGSMNSPLGADDIVLAGHSIHG